MRLLMAIILAFFSGTCALAYETLWNRVLANVLGDTIFNSALVIVVFFVGLSLGAAALRKWAVLYRSPWLAFAALEAAIALTLYPTLYVAGGGLYPGSAAGTLLIKKIMQIVSAVLLVGPPTFFMGGTLLALVQAVKPARFRGKVSFVYGLNTLGGILGIAAVTFVLIYIVGIRSTISGFMRISLAVAGIALVCHLFLGRRSAAFAVHETGAAAPRSEDAMPEALLYILSAMSGGVIIGFEVLFMHAYALVGHNSAWSFGCMLMIVIALLGTASLLSAAGRYDRRDAIAFVLPAISIALAAFPHLFYRLTGGLQFHSSLAGSLEKYLVSSVLLGLASGGPFLLLSGLLFPWILESANAHERSGVRVIGTLLALNAISAVCGAVAVQFILLPLCGVWKSCVVLGAVPLGAWLFICGRGQCPCRRTARFLCAGALAVSGVSFALHTPSVRESGKYALVDMKTGPDGVVCVKQREGKYLVMTVNNNFTLSSGSDPLWNQSMGHIPLFLHPLPKKTAFIGLATGLTASSAVQHRCVASVTVLENSPLVIEMALKHYGELTDNFHLDPRVEIVEADGVNFMATAHEAYDVIVGDLFFPWHQGAHRLYAREHFKNVRARLNPGGIFCQWLPLYQFDYASLAMVIRTFASVFPEGVVLLNTSDKFQQIGLLGIRDGRPFDVVRARGIWHERIQNETGRDRDPFLEDPGFFDTMYLGTISGLVPETTDVNTLDMPLLEEKVIQVEPTLGVKMLKINEQAARGPGVTLRELLYDCYFQKKEHVRR
jgi:spermidine synthase